jgi:hypothetical protein
MIFPTLDLYLLGDLKLRWNDSNPSVGGGVLIPREGNLKETVKKEKGAASCC